MTTTPQPTVFLYSCPICDAQHPCAYWSDDVLDAPSACRDCGKPFSRHVVVDTAEALQQQDDEQRSGSHSL